MSRTVARRIKALEAKIISKSNSEGFTYKEIPARWEDFAPLCQIRSGNEIVNFHPYSYQVQLVREIEQSSTIVICKSRQLGISETIVNYILFKSINNKGSLSLILSKTQSDTSNLAKRLRRSIESLHEYTALKSDNLQDLEFHNGGRILFRNSKPSGTRGVESVSIVLIDEMAFVENIEEIYTSVIPTTSCVENPSIILLSTPNGQSGLFYDLLNSNNGERDILQVTDEMRKGVAEPVQYWHDSTGICKFLLHWRAHPRFSKQENYLLDIQEKSGLPLSAIEQEYDLSFSHSEAIVFDSKLINSVAILEKNTDFDGRNYRYYAGLDVATSSTNTGDYLVFVILKEDIRTEKIEMVDYYRDRGQTFSYYIEKIKEKMRHYYPISTTIEVTGGEGSIYLETLENDEPVFNYHPFKTTQSSKIAIVNRLNLYFQKQKLTLLNDENVIGEFKAFRRKDKSLEAARGYHDDLVIATALAVQSTIEYLNS